MKPFFSFILPLVFLVITCSVSSCSKDNDKEPVAPVLTPSEVSLLDNGEATVAISGGVAPYQLSGGDATIATAMLSGSNITVKALKAGKSTVTITGKDGGKATLTITITAIVNPVLTPPEVSIADDEETTVAISSGVAPYQLSGGDATIATVTLSGSNITVKAIKAGSSTVTVTGKDGGKSTLTITVTESLTTIEDARYHEFVTPELETSLVDKLGVTINRGINPPDITGYYRMENRCTKSTISGDSFVGNLINHFKLKFYDQKDMELNFEGFQVSTDGTDRYIAQSVAKGNFISGESDKFSVFLNVENKSAFGTLIYFYVFSGEVVRDTDKKIIGIKNMQQVFLMRENYGISGYIANGEGRLFEDDYVDAISKEEYERITNKPEVKRASVGYGASPDASAFWDGR